MKILCPDCNRPLIYFDGSIICDKEDCDRYVVVVKLQENFK